MNSFYYYYFLRKRGLVLPDETDDYANVVLNYMTAPESVCETAAASLGISPLWLSSVPVIFSRKTFALYVNANEIYGASELKPSEEGIIYTHANKPFYDSLLNVLGGTFVPRETPKPQPYAMVRALARMKNVSVEEYLRSQFEFEERDSMDSLIRDVVQAGCNIPSGTMSVCDHGVIRDLAKKEDLTIEEAASGFEVKDEACLLNLMLAFKLCVSCFTVKYNKDGSILISYPGYKLSDFGRVHQEREFVPERPHRRDNSMRHGISDEMR